MPVVSEDDASREGKTYIQCLQQGKMLSMAGIRMANPDASAEQVWHLWARRHLGDELYEKAYEGRSSE